MMLLLKLLGIVCWFADFGGLLYLFNVGCSHAGINWHGMPTIVRLSVILGLILAGSALLAWLGFVKLAVLVAVAPVILGIGTFGFVLVIYLLFGGSH
jgi:hypothetical protein